MPSTIRSTRRPLVPIVLLVVGGIGGCADRQPDAHGSFEAIEVAVAAEATGQLLSFAVNEGDVLAARTIVGQIDTTAPALQLREVGSQLRAARARSTEAAAQIEVLRAQLETASEEHERTVRLFRAEAATSSELTRAEGEVRVLRTRIEAAMAQVATAEQDQESIAARQAQLEEQLRRTIITNPVSGTVLASYAEAGEYVQRGQPLYRVADLSELTLRVYVSGAQLSSVRIGEALQVSIDGAGGELLTLPGTVAWIASDAEFTPTPIQTRDERTTQVYAVGVRVPNPHGRAKIGMPADVTFSSVEEAALTGRGGAER